MFSNKNIVAGAFLIFSFFFISCKDKKENEVEQTITQGSATFLVDETLVPIIEDQVSVFESNYNAKIKLNSKSEAEIINSLLNEKGVVAILSRDLTKKELKKIQDRKILPKITKFAIDGIAFISNKSNKDTLIALEDVIKFMQGKSSGSGIKGLVFDNPNSSTLRYIKELAGLSLTPENGVFSFKTNEEVIKFVSENDGVLGVVGVNWLSQPSHKSKLDVEKVKVLHVKSIGGSNYYAPTQNNMAEGTYPLARDLYIVNCQGYAGLGMGFTSFIIGDIGQRIILKSGLLPIRIPGRQFNIRSEINSDNNK